MTNHAVGKLRGQCRVAGLHVRVEKQLLVEFRRNERAVLANGEDDFGGYRSRKCAERCHAAGESDLSTV